MRMNAESAVRGPWSVLDGRCRSSTSQLLFLPGRQTANYELLTADH